MVQVYDSNEYDCLCLWGTYWISGASPFSWFWEYQWSGLALARFSVAGPYPTWYFAEILVGLTNVGLPKDFALRRSVSTYSDLNGVVHTFNIRTHLPHISLDVLIGPSQQVYNNRDGLVVGSTRCYIEEPNREPLKRLPYYSPAHNGACRTSIELRCREE